LRIWIKLSIIIVIVIFAGLIFMVLTNELYYKAARDRLSLLGPPELRSEGFISEEFVTGLKLPTKMTFVGDDILILEKIGSVRHVTSNGTLIPEPILELEVATVAESGLIGIISKDAFVYLYYTEPEGEEKIPKANKVVKYRWTGSNLVDPVLLKELPAGEKGFHNGGAMTIGKDGTVYLVIGDIVTSNTILQNIAGEDPNDTGVILPVDPPGDYYGIGIRNSYGLATDPTTGNIWETENGPRRYIRHLMQIFYLEDIVLQQLSRGLPKLKMKRNLSYQSQSCFH